VGCKKNCARFSTTKTNRRYEDEKPAYTTFLHLVIEARAEHPEWRVGQTLFNILHQLAPDLAEEIRGAAIDPFYQDSRIPKFLEYIKKNWEE